MPDDAGPLPQLPPRKLESHKGDYGRAVLCGGSRGMSGAISLAGLAALRGGAGLVTMAVPDRCLETVAGFEPSLMTRPLPNDPQGRLNLDAAPPLCDLIGQSTAAGCGPGLGHSDDLRQLMRTIYQTVEQPLVIDADGLNALSNVPDGLCEPSGPRVLTPHPGEFRRLWHDPELPADRLADCAVQLAARHQVVVVLKGHHTLITDGQRTSHNQTGNPGMATGGSGDVLTGLITALLCQQLSPWDAARLAVHLHGLAGDLAAEQLGQRCMIASDLVGFLPAAFLQYQQASET